MPILIRCCSQHTIVPMVRRGPAGGVIALVAIAAVLIWAHLAVAALTLCLNETPVLASGIGEALPAVDGVARWLLPLFTPLGVAAVSPPSCDPAAQAKALAVAGLACLGGIF